MARKTLPNKPSALIRLAVDDLEKTERDSLDIVVMASWVEPIKLGLADREGNIVEPNAKWNKILPRMPKKGICTVCFAGAVMRRSFGVEMGSLDPNDIGIRTGDVTLADKLFALDKFRSGLIQEGFLRMAGEKAVPVDEWQKQQDAIGELGPEIKVASYADDPKQFKKVMRELATALEGYGL